MANYTDHLVSSVAETISELTSSGELERMAISEDACIAVQNCATKMSIVLTVNPDASKAFYSLLFMCRSAYSCMSKLLSVIPDALKEVSTFHLLILTEWLYTISCRIPHIF